MKKLLVILSVLALFALAAVPSFAQDEEPTIAELVVASTEAEAPEFTVLLAAVGAADPGFLELLSDPNANVTVFAPTDAAFTAALEALGLTAEELLADTETLNRVLAYHVVPGAYDAASVVALDGALIGTYLNESALTISVEGDAVMVDDATVVAADVMASNGVVHVIDSVLLPPEPMEMSGDMMAEPTMSIAETVVAATESDAPQFATLLAAVAAADPIVLDSLTNYGPYTVFAPTDEAFAAALEALGLTAEELLADTETLTAILAYHVVPGKFSAETVVAAAGSMMDEGVNVATLLSGTTVSITTDGTNVYVNDATVIATDVFATNGVIHVIDSVILPPME